MAKSAKKPKMEREPTTRKGMMKDIREDEAELKGMPKRGRGRPRKPVNK